MAQVCMKLEVAINKWPNKTRMPSDQIQGRVRCYFNSSDCTKSDVQVKGIANHLKMTASSGTNDDCLRPNSILGGTTLPTSKFWRWPSQQWLHFSTNLGQVRDRYSLSLFSNLSVKVKVIFNPLATPWELGYPTYEEDDQNYNFKGGPFFKPIFALKPWD